MVILPALARRLVVHGGGCGAVWSTYHWAGVGSVTMFSYAVIFLTLDEETLSVVAIAKGRGL